MEEEKKYSELANEICRILILNDEESGLPEALKCITLKMGLSGAVVFMPGDKPFVMKSQFIYEPEKRLGDMLEFSFSELLDDGGYKSRSGEERIIFNNRVNADSFQKPLDLFAAKLGVESYLMARIENSFDYLGALVLYDMDKEHIWTDEEKQVTVEIAGLLYGVLLKIRRHETEMQLLEDSKREARESREIKNRFLSNISHEIRTPLYSIMGMTTIMRHNSSDPAVLEQCVEKIEGSSRQMIELFNKCIDITLFDDNTVMLSNSWFTFEDLEKDIRMDVRPMTDVCEQKFVIEYPEGTQVCGDREKLIKILDCILANAFKFTRESGEISLKISCKAVHGSKYIYEFVIRDDGIGMNPEFLKKAFEPFTKELIRLNGAINGAGLGMTIAKHLVEILHGEIDILSAPGEGTCVTITIPLERDEEEIKQYLPGGGSLSDDEDYSFTEMYIGRRMLVAEDNTLMAEILIELLGYRGIEADLACNGREAVEMYRSHDEFYYDMILMDLQMPEMDGYEATGLIRASGRADAGIIPIAALSADTFDDAIARAMESGMNVHLSKPISESALMNTISRFVL